jgi:hypothetical protein
VIAFSIAMPNKHCTIMWAKNKSWLTDQQKTDTVENLMELREKY